MTFPRAVVLLCALAALADGAVWEAVFLVLFVVVLWVFWPAGVGRRPVPFRIWWHR
jgi:predicted Abi (CAAX) family protease